MTLFDLTGKVAIITGASRGIGEAIAHRMAEHGSRVVISSRKAEACDKVRDAINDKHKDSAITVPAHIGDKDALQNLVDETLSAFGRIDTLVCNAAINPYFGASADCPDEVFDKLACLYGCPLYAESGRGEHYRYLLHSGAYGAESLGGLWYLQSCRFRLGA